MITAPNLERLYLSLTAQILDEIFSFEIMAVKSTYMNNIASIFGGDLHTSVKNLLNNSEEHIKLLSKYQETIPQTSVNEQNQRENKQSHHEAVVKHRFQLNQSIKKVIEEATKIKTRI